MAPGEADTAQFDGTLGGDVSLNVGSIGTVETAATYTGNLLLPNNARVTVKLLTMSGGTIKSSGAIAGSLELLYASNLMTGGTIDNATLRVGSSDAMKAPSGATLRIDGDITLKDGGQLYIYDIVGNGNPNEVNWQSGSISTPALAGGGASGAEVVNDGGVLLINSNGLLGSPASTSTRRLLNRPNGTTTVYSTPTIAGSFVNVGTLSVRSAANLNINGTAKQTGGTTELRGGTITLTAATGVYAVEAGSLIGDGTLAANVTLGTLGNGAVTISPGYTGAEIGTLTITKSLHMVSNSVATSIQVFANGTFDKILIPNGYAILNGSLTVNIAVGYKPAQGTKHIFLRASTLTAPGGTAPTRFGSETISGQTDLWLAPPKTLGWEIDKDTKDYWVVVDEQAPADTPGEV